MTNNNIDNIIKILLDVWDPLALFPLAPDDEYEEEIDSIIKYINQGDITVVSLSEHIYSVYKSSFGNHFDYLNADCDWIARKIISILAVTSTL